MQQHSEVRLLLLARSGDKEAFGDLMTQYQPMGQGQIWLDHLTFETVGPEVAVTTLL